jgi:hypothetical protein
MFEPDIYTPGDSILHHPLPFQQNGHGTIIMYLHKHVCTEDAGFYMDTIIPERPGKMRGIL